MDEQTEGRVQKLHLSGSVTPRGELRLKGRRGMRRPFVEVKVAYEWFRKAARWHRVERRADRDADLYTERITDKASGSLVKSVREPLSAHRGHGAARRER